MRLTLGHFSQVFKELREFFDYLDGLNISAESVESGKGYILEWYFLIRELRA
ncbi:MAG: hypothetical protein ACI9R3_000694 [Verrucomicrobiales bacterium]|jgi:hypothetical protein